MNKGDLVEIIDIDKKEKWLVRNKKNLNQVCFFLLYYLFSTTKVLLVLSSVKKI